MTKEYSLTDVINELHDVEFEMPFEGKDGKGTISFKIKPLTYGVLKILMRRAGGDELSAADEIVKRSVVELVKNADGNITEKPVTADTLDKLPPGIVTQMATKVNEVSGFGVELSEVKK